MKKTLLLTLALLISAMRVCAQVTIREYSAPKPAVPEVGHYDSLKSTVENPEVLLGQQMYFLPKSERLRKYPIDGVDSDAEVDRTDRVDYEEVAGKFYLVTGVLPVVSNSVSRKDEDRVLRLVERESKATIYYYYAPSAWASIKLDVVPLGYIVKLQQTHIGSFWLVKRNVNDGKPRMIDLKTGERDVHFQQQVWRCADVAIESRYYSIALILESDSGQQVSVSIEYVNRGVESLPSRTYLEDTYGSEIRDMILAGLVKVGMTSEACRYSWGSPKKINQTVSGGLHDEQWVYDSDSYLYMSNGILVTIQK